MLNDMLDRQMQHARKNPVKTNDLEADSQYRELIAHVLKPNEKLGEFVARTGLGKMQALGMSKEEITRFVQVAEERENDSPYSPAAWQRTNNLPQHFVLED
jgi:hypothetical protein